MSVSYIDLHEQQEAETLIESQLGFKLPVPVNDHMIVKLYLRPEEIFTVTREDGKEIKFYLPESVRALDKFRSCVALVVAMGPLPEAPCRVGDFIMIPRHEGVQITYRDWVLHILKVDKFYGAISDPGFITIT